jgi:serine phosphatase RsbU (regulator of sigma subunit)
LALENRDLEAAVEILKSFKTELEVKQKSIAKDLKLAKNIQKGIIPRTIPDWNGIQFWTYFSPMQEVSGDYYDYFPYNDSKLGIAVCDVSGHGVPAAFITALSKMLFNVYRSPQPSNIFKNVNRDLLELLQHQGYTTCIYAVIDDNYKITYSVAGHPRPILLRHKTSSAHLLEGEGTFLGMFPEANDYYEDQSVQMEPGDKIFLYTDGITEALNDDGEQFGEERLIQAILQTLNMSIQKSIEHITSIYNEFTMGTDQGDDITIFGFSLSPHIDDFDKLVSEGNLQYRNKNYSKATECFQSANKIMPRDMKNILLLSKSLAKEGKYTEAIECLLNYNRYKMHDYESHFILGFCHFQIKEYEKAEAEFKKAIYMDDSHPAVHYNLIRVYAKLGNVSKFNEALAKMRKLFPSFNKYAELNSLMEKN